MFLDIMECVVHLFLITDVHFYNVKPSSLIIQIFQTNGSIALGVGTTGENGEIASAQLLCQFVSVTEITSGDENSPPFLRYLIHD